MNSMSRRIFVVALSLMAVGLASAARAQGTSEQLTFIPFGNPHSVSSDYCLDGEVALSVS